MIREDYYLRHHYVPSPSPSPCSSSSPHHGLRLSQDHYCLAPHAARLLLPHRHLTPSSRSSCSSSSRSPPHGLPHRLHYCPRWTLPPSSPAPHQIQLALARARTCSHTPLPTPIPTPIPLPTNCVRSIGLSGLHWWWKVSHNVCSFMSWCLWVSISS